MQIIKTQCPHCGQAHDAYIQPTVAPQVAARQAEAAKARIAELEGELKELRAELEAARAVVAASRTGFGTEEDIKRAWAFDPNALTATIRAYDATVKAKKQ